MSLNLLVFAALLYVGFLFTIASFAETRANEAGGRGRLARLLRSPLVYTLSLSVYCTAWTFYGAVGYAARSGLEFLTIYLGPTLVFVGWWWLLRRLVRLGRSQRATSIADFISSRYGKSNAVGVIVTLLATAAYTPYIALQLQSIAGAFSAVAGDAEVARRGLAFWTAAGLALFTILFGTRNLDANEQHPGVVTAIAVEALVKLVALLAVGVFVVWFVADGPSDIYARILAAERPEWVIRPDRWAGLTLLSAVAIVTLPRMFQLIVVENSDERHLATASWAFPLYMCAMSLFVLPIAVVGLELLPEGANPDLFVLTIPLAEGRNWLALLAFLGGFSAATSMVIIASIALATMISNHIVLPLWLRSRQMLPGQSGREMRDLGDMRGLVLNVRRLLIGVILALGYVHFAATGGGQALASIGLIAFAGMAQVLPALVAALWWRGASRIGALIGVGIGALVWLYTLFLPGFGAGVILPAGLMEVGPFGIGWLRPQALFGSEGLDPLLHTLFWSLLLNTIGLVLGSLLSYPGPIERVQAEQFAPERDPGDDPLRAVARGWARAGEGAGGEGESEDLLVMAQRILGAPEAQALFQAEARAQGKDGFLPDPSPGFLDRLERRLAGSVGAATAHAMVSQTAVGRFVTVDDLLAVASETARVMEHSAQLLAQSEQLTRTAGQLREANEMLQKLSVQKDSFLSQISHELRTPMTSISAFAEILRGGEVEPEEQLRYAGIIHEESIRLTRLLDDLLDLSVLENGQVSLDIQEVRLVDLIERAVLASANTLPHRDFAILRDEMAETMRIETDPGRLTQVLINVIVNARKYSDGDPAWLRISVRRRAGMVIVDLVDSGSGIPKASQALIFEKFSRLTDTHMAGGAGLGLAICREIMQNLGGEIRYVPGQGGAAFRLSFPQRLGPKRLRR